MLRSGETHFDSNKEELVKYLVFIVNISWSENPSNTVHSGCFSDNFEKVQ